jgi:hypothetical protein
MIQTLFANNDAFSKATVPPFTQLELFRQDLKSMKMNFNTFPGRTVTRFDTTESP